MLVGLANQAAGRLHIFKLETYSKFTYDLKRKGLRKRAQNHNGVLAKVSPTPPSKVSSPHGKFFFRRNNSYIRIPDSSFGNLFLYGNKNRMVNIETKILHMKVLLPDRNKKIHLQKKLGACSAG